MSAKEVFVNGIEGQLDIEGDTVTFTSDVINVTVRPISADEGTVLSALTAMLTAFGLPKHS